MRKLLDLFRTAKQMHQDQIDQANQAKQVSPVNQVKLETVSATLGTANLGALAEAAKNLGNTYVMAGDLRGAEHCYREALTLLPTYAEAKVNLASVLRQSGQLQEAKQNLLDAITLKPSLWQAHFQLGLLLNDLGELQAAVDSYTKAIERNPGGFDSRWYLGVTLTNLRKWNEAVQAFEFAPLPENDLQPLHAHYGLALMNVKRLNDALHHLQIAIKLAETPDLHVLVGTIYEDLWMKQEAELSFRRAIALDPNHAKAHYLLSFLLLLKGDYLDGFTHYEQRLQLTEQAEWLDPIKTIINGLGAARYWRGQNISNANITVITEQGLGDALMMLRYIPLLKTVKGASRICVVCDEPLASIYRSITEVDEVRVKPANLLQTDVEWYCSTMSLPHIFQTQLVDIPTSLSLQIPEQRKNKWTERLAGLHGLKIGVAWSGNNRLDTDGIRSITLDKLRPLFDLPGTAWISLQKGAAAELLKTANTPVHDWMDDATDLMDTAALMSSLDLIITVDTSIVHLAGVVNRPTWLLNRYDTEWRWHLAGEESAWYSNVRILRQTSRNDWSGVVDNAAAELRRQLQS